MTNIPTNVRNYFKLQLLLARSHDRLRQLFKTRFPSFNNGNVWNDSPTCGHNYLTNVITKNKINLTPMQKTLISNGDSNEWDITILTVLLLYINRPKTLNKTQLEQLDSEDQLLTQLRNIRNTVAHSGSVSLTDDKFNQLWTELSSILVAFGDVDSELDKLKDDSVFELNTQSINEENVKEASRFNSLGTQAHKDGKFSDAIKLFKQVISLAGVSAHDRAIFYSNMSSSRLALYKLQLSCSDKSNIEEPIDQRYSALRDAKQARNLWQTWWKGHFRVGKVYAALNEHEKAIRSFERALALAPTNNEIQKALDESRQIHGQQLRYEHLDPRLQPRTLPEQLNELKQKFGLDPQHVRLGHNLLEESDPSGSDVIKGHKYEHGDIDVKQDYEQAAKYFAKAARQGNAEGIYNLARLTDHGLGVKKDHDEALKLFEQAAAQPPQHPLLNGKLNVGVAEAEHALGLRYFEGVGIQKDLPTAAYWYQRAVDHGCAESANNLAIMYQDGIGVDQNLDKAEQLFELASRGGDPNAMLSLANLLLHKKNFEMAKIWFNRACESGNIHAQTRRDIFEKTIQEKPQLIEHCPPNILQMLNVTTNVFDSLKTNKTVSTLSNRSFINDYNVLKKHSGHGSITAKKLCNAMEHFEQALSILIQAETLTEEQEDIFVHELSQCYRIEHIVAQITSMEIHKKILQIVKQVLHRSSTESNAVASQLDEDARTCYAVLHMDSSELVSQFLEQCKQKYPKSIYFYELSSAVYCFQCQYEAALYDANTGLEIDPNYYELLYHKAVALRLLGINLDETIEAYQAFLTIAPKDHRKVPESYYAMGNCFFQRDSNEDIVKKNYQQGEEAEKLQLPCFLPYQSNSKMLLRHMFDIKFLLNTEQVPLIDRRLRLKNPHRIEIIKQHREWEAKFSKVKNNPNYLVKSHTHIPRVKQQTVKSLIGLKTVSLREMDPRKDHVYNECVLSVTIIEETSLWTPSIHLVIEDEHLDCERMFIYGFSEAQGEYLINEVFTLGSKMNIINPYLRLGANDMKSSIRVDDFSSIIMQNKSERLLNMCRCGEPNALHVCNRCKQARYCTKECQTIDWQLYKHKLICKKQ